VRWATADLESRYGMLLPAVAGSCNDGQLGESDTEPMEPAGLILVQAFILLVIIMLAGNLLPRGCALLALSNLRKATLVNHGPKLLTLRTLWKSSSL